MQRILPDKSCQDRLFWLALASGGLPVLPCNTGALPFPSYENNRPSSSSFIHLLLSARCPWTKLGFHLQKSYSQRLLLHRNCHYRQVWLALASLAGALTCLPNTGNPCFPSYGKELAFSSRHKWLKLGFNIHNSKYPRVGHRQTCQYRPVCLALASGDCSVHQILKHRGSVVFFLWRPL